MLHTFPTIRTINDVLPIVEAREEFRVFNNGEFNVVNYTVVTHTTFGNPTKEPSEEDLIARECRGLCFDFNGNIIGRRFHKFFNFNERAETSANNVDMSANHVIMEKLDGSMVSPIIVDGEIIWTTKSGQSDVSAQAAGFVNDGRDNYINFTKYCYQNGYNPIFEWCSRMNKVVVDHPIPTLVLTAIRNIYTGEYVSYNELVKQANDYDIPYVKTVNPGTSNIEEVASFVKDMEGEEGIIITFGNKFIKFKSDWYMSIHRTLDLFVHPRHLANVILTNTADDVKAMLDSDRKQNFENFEKEFFNKIDKLIDIVLYILNNVKRNTNEDRKNFAQSKMFKELSIITALVMRNWSNHHVTRHDILEQIMELYSKKVFTNIAYDTFMKDTDKIIEIFEKNYKA